MPICNRCQRNRPAKQFPTYRVRGVVRHRQPCETCHTESLPKVKASAAREGWVYRCRHCGKMSRNVLDMHVDLIKDYNPPHF